MARTRIDLVHRLRSILAILRSHLLEASHSIVAVERIEGLGGVQSVELLKDGAACAGREGVLGPEWGKANSCRPPGC